MELQRGSFAHSQEGSLIGLISCWMLPRQWASSFQPVDTAGTFKLLQHVSDSNVIKLSSDDKQCGTVWLL